ncbi:MAG: 50S ribosomal protein L18e [Promethearchaeati archaeon SRVP18_Atabeyarchaeia-1]
MSRRSRPNDPTVLRLLRDLRKKSNEQKVELWRHVSERLANPRRRIVEVNLSRINRHTKAKDVVLVPGKVLASGELDHEVSVAALSFSKNAKGKIEKAKGKVLTLMELSSKNPKGTKVILME